MSTWLQDLKYALRIHTRASSITPVAVLTLALGIGASVAVFSVVNAILLQPLSYPEAEKIVIPWRLVPPGLNLGYDEFPWGLHDFRLFLNESKTFQSLGAFKSDSFNLTGSGEPTVMEGLRVSTGFFSALGISPGWGRTFTMEEDQPGHEHEVILSYAVWQSQFGGRTDILGNTMDLNGEAYTVVGVMPSGFAFPRAEEMPGSFSFPREAELWVPLALPLVPRPNQPADLAVIGRLRPGITIASAQEEMNIFAKREEVEFPKYKGWFNSRVTPLTTQVTGNMHRPLLLLMGAVGVVLLICCSNVANLLLTRSIGRKREFTLRAALGAGRFRIIRQLLIESVLLAVGGGLAGTLVAAGAIYCLKIFGPTDVPRLREVGLHLWVFAFTIGITFITGILFGLAPAISAARENLFNSLKEGGQRTSGSAKGSKIRNSLMILEVAFALVLVVSAGLLMQTFFRLLRVDGGFNPDRVLTFELSLPDSKYPDTDRIVALYQRALQQLQSVPGVRSAAIAYTVPMDGATESGVIRIPDHPVADNQAKPFSNYNIASPGFFSTVGTPVLRGREFLESDTADSVPVTIINSAMAKKYWPGEDPLGRQLGLGSLRFPAMTIVGIVGDVKQISLREDPGPEMYVPYTQKPYPSMLTMHVVLRTASDPISVAGGTKKAIYSLDRDIPVTKLATLQAVVKSSMAGPRFSLLLLGSFAALALLLASVGLYGVISYSVTQRTPEIGIRMALGANRRNVFGMVIGQGVRLVVAGIVIGIVASLMVTRLMTSFLYGVRPTDPLTFTAVSLLLAGISLFSCYLPALRATRVDPMIALRYE
ncbi:MAG: ABC transporter permease [Acidobacteriia bacterium]|nr:ABC transporter permease [Terriglobia bacterium]